MRLIAVGLSHRTAPIELRERVDFGRGGLDSALESLAGSGITREAVVLTTCNRSEIYATTDNDAAVDALRRFFSEYHGIDHLYVAQCLYVHRGAEAARHLFRVAAGLDSLVVGEPQILGQVKAAYSIAHDGRHTSALMNRLFHAAFAVGKRVRAETRLGEGAVSVSYAATSLAKKIFGDLRDLCVLILGAGEMAKLTGLHLQTHEVRQMTIVSRTFAAASALASQLGGQARAWADLDAALSSADIVVSATGAADPVLTRGRVEDVMRRRRSRPLFIIDIAVPRDAEAAVGDVDQVFLYHIDDLQTIVKENLSRRASVLAEAESIIDGEVARFTAWMQSRELIPTVVALRQRFEAIRQAEMQRLEPKLARLSPEARERVDEITHLIIEKLLLAPTEQLKAVTDDARVMAYSDALSRLFNLADETTEQPQNPAASQESQARSK